MPTTGTVLGKNLLVYTGTTPVVISCQGAGTLNMESDTTAAVCKDSGAWAEELPGRISWSIEISEALLAFDATNGINALVDAFRNRTVVTVYFSTGVTGDKRWKGSAYVTNLTVNAPIDGAASYNVTFSGKGELIYEDIP